MASIRSAQDRAIKTGFLDLLGESPERFEPVKLETLATSLAWLAAQYTDKLKDKLNIADATSSGDLADSIMALDVEIFGTIYEVAITAQKYMDYINEGVSGWARSRNSRFQFRTKGVDPDGEHVKKMKEWLLREGNISRNTKVAVSNREQRRAKITDATTRAAISAAYMVKREGIAPTYFWRDATVEMDALLSKELGAALKIDIIDNLSNTN